MNPSHQLAMSDGRIKVRAATVWQLDIGQVGLRCVYRPKSLRPSYLIQVRTPGATWTDAARTESPHGALLQLANGKLVTDAIETAKDVTNEQG